MLCPLVGRSLPADGFAIRVSSVPLLRLAAAQP